MRKGVLFALALSLVFVVTLAVVPCGFTQTVTLKYTNFFPAPHKHSLLAEQWGVEVEKRTNGRVKVIYYPAATLTPATQTYDSVVKGIADVGMSCQAYTRGKFPLSEVIDLPLSYRSGLVATRMTNEFLKKFQPKEYDETQVMFLHAHGPGLLHTKKPVTKLEEMKGLKVRAGMDGVLGLKGWQWIFIIEATPAVLLAFVVLKLMTDRPTVANWLTPEERQWLEGELQAERSQIESNSGRALLVAG